MSRRSRATRSDGSIAGQTEPTIVQCAFEIICSERRHSVRLVEQGHAVAGQHRDKIGDGKLEGERDQPASRGNGRITLAPGSACQQLSGCRVFHTSWSGRIYCS